MSASAETPWIECHVNLPGLPKFRNLKHALGAPPNAVAGSLVLLWTSALQTQVDGDLTGWRPETIADAAGWEGDAQDFVEALVAEHWLDRDGDRLTIHDWDDYTARYQRLVQEREQARVRMARLRAAEKENAPAEPRSPDVRRTFSERAPNVPPLNPVPETVTGDPGTGDDSLPGGERENAQAREQESTPTPGAAPARATTVQRFLKHLGKLGLSNLPHVSDGQRKRLNDAGRQDETLALDMAEAWLAVARGEWDDDWLRRHLTPDALLSKIHLWRELQAAPTEGPPEAAEPREPEGWPIALPRMAASAVGAPVQPSDPLERPAPKPRPMVPPAPPPPNAEEAARIWAQVREHVTDPTLLECLAKTRGYAWHPERAVLAVATTDAFDRPKLEKARGLLSASVAQLAARATARVDFRDPEPDLIEPPAELRRAS